MISPSQNFSALGKARQIHAGNGPNISALANLILSTLLTFRNDRVENLILLLGNSVSSQLKTH